MNAFYQGSDLSLLCIESYSLEKLWFGKIRQLLYVIRLTTTTTKMAGQIPDNKLCLELKGTLLDHWKNKQIIKMITKALFQMKSVPQSSDSTPLCRHSLTSRHRIPVGSPSPPQSSQWLHAMRHEKFHYVTSIINNAPKSACM